MNDRPCGGRGQGRRALPDAPPSAVRKAIAPPRRRRPRLAAEITVALLVKFLLLYGIWVAWFSHPAGDSLNGESVAAALLGASRQAAIPAGTGNDPRH